MRLRRLPVRIRTMEVCGRLLIMYSTCGFAGSSDLRLFSIRAILRRSIRPTRSVVHASRSLSDPDWRIIALLPFEFSTHIRKLRRLSLCLVIMLSRDRWAA